MWLLERERESGDFLFDCVVLCWVVVLVWNCGDES